MFGMNRREFITLLGGAVATRPLAARAQQSEQMPRIGVLLPFVENDPEAKVWIAEFEAALTKLGRTKDQNIRIAYRRAGADQHLVEMYAAELVQMTPALLLAAAVPPLIALHKQTRSIPIVFVQVSDPIKLGLVASLARPGGNITGFVNFEHSIGGKWIESLKGIAPDTNRVSVLFDPENPAMASYVEAISAAAPSFAVPVTPAGVRNSTDIESTMNALAQQPRGALIVLPNAVTIRYRDLIVAMAISQRLPAIYVYRLFTRAGGLISYGVDLSDQYRLAAGYVDRILKGEHAGELPIQLPAKFEMVINLKTARALGLAIPPTLLALADEVIE